MVHEKLGKDVELVISEIGVVADWSAAYTPNSGPMDAVMKVQMTENRKQSAQQAVETLRETFANSKDFSDLEFSFDAGGMIRAAMNAGKSTPLNVRITGRDLDRPHRIAENVKAEVAKVNGVVDLRIVHRLDYPEYIVDVDRAKAADLGLTQKDVMENLVAALNSSIQFNKKISGSTPLHTTNTTSASPIRKRILRISARSWTCRSTALRKRGRFRSAIWPRCGPPRFRRKSRTTTSSRPST